MSGRHLTDITHDEVVLLNAAMASLDIDEVRGEAMHLRLFEGGRQWIIEADIGQLVIDVDDESCQRDGEEMFPVSERVRRFADVFAVDTLALSIADDRTLVVSAGSASAAIDLVPQRRPMPSPWHILPAASATMPMFEFRRLLWSARCLPSGIGDESYPMPPMWLQISDGWLGLHVDWTDFLASRATYRLDTTIDQGRATVALPHPAIEQFLQNVPMFDDEDDALSLSLTVGTVRHEGATRDAIVLESDSWRLILWLVNPLEANWSARVNREFEAAGIEVRDTDGVEWIVESNDIEVRVKLHQGHPDVARVSTVLVQSASESIELLRELGQLNAASVGVRYWLEHDVVRAAVDVPCTVLTELPAAVRRVADAAAAHAPMLAVWSSAA